MIHTIPIFRKNNGFTLIELMVVVAIIGILASIAIPKFADMVRKAKEGANKGSLGTIKSALSIYYSDNEGWYPAYCVPGCDFTIPSSGSGSPTGLEALTINAKYLAMLPTPIPPYYHNLNSITGIEMDYALLSNTPSNFELTNAQGGRWIYFGNPLYQGAWGQVFENCTHTDSRGTSWTFY